MPTTVLITGAAGFIGRQVTREAARQGMDLRLMSHRRPLPGSDGEATAGRSPVTGRPALSVRADLADPPSLRGVCEGVEVLLHCAAQIGGTPETNETVNARGTQALVAEARRAGVSRIVQISTASVYGRGDYRRARPEDLVRNPESPTSATRAVAEDAVLAAGGIVLRPHFVHGPGDTWLVSGLAGVLQALPGTVEGWPARLSLVSVHDLARLAVGASLAPLHNLTASVYHCAHPEPVTARDLLRAVADCAGLAWPPRELTIRQARDLLSDDPRSRHALGMLTSDHWFDGEQLWSDLAEVPGPPFAESFARYAPWYREQLRPARQ
ncbi:NAD(P)-dependent oxidoreductase [Streptomyces sp. Ru72]|uniref:NAD-dependent epimerase/dehydratase family protein n=1 Tax=Streptomyces sp. Ru72 TaxID=2080747 RepID=UPI000CDD3132|nr:NAD(P)-dependent oxidoreductase [Streptomyces sp. Ru72]POX45964.1 autoregulator biosynthesis enzyme [Streptomyces sp. Ru72]